MVLPFLSIAMAGSTGSADESSPEDPVGVDLITPSPDDGADDGIVGGDPVRRGDWDDAVGLLMYGFYVGCSGTLIGPKVVLTAGHCVTGYPVTHVLVGSKDSTTDQGEKIEVAEVIEYPNSQSSYDVALLLLAKESKYQPREIALDCIVKDYLEDGAAVQMVGWGMTSEYGDDYFNHELNEAPSEILDKNCDETTINGFFAGCNPVVSPGGEIAAGGNGTNVCYGDSGGPLYLRTERGDYVTGVASRLFLGSDPQRPCSSGQIWVRPDAVINWIEDNVGNREIRYPSCNEPPETEIAPISTVRNRAGTTVLTISDRDGDPTVATVEISQPPAHGSVEVGAEGALTYTPDRGYVGEDSFTVAVTDEGTDFRRTGDPVTVETDVLVTVAPGFLGCGCATGAGTSGAGALSAGLIVLALARRRARVA